MLGPGCQLGEDATIDGAILWAENRVGKKALLKNCIIGSRCDLQDGCQVTDNCVLGDNVTVGKNTRLPQGTKVLPDEQVDQS
jgi:NDP-sugar pyrophosphorylase family protein